MLPCIYEIDPASGEANGTVHPFCSPDCRDVLLPRITAEIASRGFSTALGQGESYGDGTECERCRASI